MQKFKDVNEVVNVLKPDYPVYCIRTESIKKSTKFFKDNFPGKILYAVKTNPNEKVIKQIISSGIEDFDVASINEIQLIKKLNSSANLYFMHTIKSKESISESGELCCPILPNLRGENKNRVYYYSIFPNLLLSLHPEYVMTHTIWPDGYDKCIVECSWLFEKHSITSNKYKPDNAIKFWNITNKQDWHISELSQLGIQSKMYAPAPYSGQESLLAAFDKYYLSIIDR